MEFIVYRVIGGLSGWRGLGHGARLYLVKLLPAVYAGVYLLISNKFAIISGLFAAFVS